VTGGCDQCNASCGSSPVGGPVSAERISLRLPKSQPGGSHRPSSTGPVWDDAKPPGPRSIILRPQ